MNLSRLAICLGAFILSPAAHAREPVPDRLVVLTFDDSVRSHFTIVRPILKDYGFGATFFITEGFDFKTNKNDYMTWEQIAQLSRDGFEIGNHTRDHMAVTAQSVDQLPEQVAAINDRCREHGIPATTTFAFPANRHDPRAFEILKNAGIRFARRGGEPEFPYKNGRGVAYEPDRDHPLFIPSAGDARPDWTLDDFVRAVSQAKRGKIAVLQFHGVPDIQHPWVHTPRENFELFMKYLQLHDYTVIALRDLENYVDPDDVPDRYDTVIEERKRSEKLKE